MEISYAISCVKKQYGLGVIGKNGCHYNIDFKPNTFYGENVFMSQAKQV